METGSKRCGMGRRRVVIEHIRNKDKLYSCFSKRRRGIFKKAGELATLCGIQIAVLTVSTGGKLFSFGHPSVEAVIDQYLDVPLPQVPEPFDAPPSCLERKPGELPGGQFWWVDSIHVLDELQDLEMIYSRAEKIRRAILKKANVLASAREELEVNGSDCVQVPYVPSWGWN